MSAVTATIPGEGPGGFRAPLADEDDSPPALLPTNILVLTTSTGFVSVVDTSPVIMLAEKWVGKPSSMLRMMPFGPRIQSSPSDAAPGGPPAMAFTRTLSVMLCIRKCFTISYVTHCDAVSTDALIAAGTTP